MLFLQYIKNNVLTRLNFKIFLYSVIFYDFYNKISNCKSLENFLLYPRCCWFEIGRSYVKLHALVETRHHVWQLLPLSTVFKNLLNGSMRRAVPYCIQPLWKKTPQKFLDLNPRMLKLAEYRRPEVRYQLLFLFLFPLLVEQKDFQKIVSSNVVLRPLSYSNWQVGGGVWHAV